MEQQKNAVTGIPLLEMDHGIVQIPDVPGQKPKGPSKFTFMTFSPDGRMMTIG